MSPRLDAERRLVSALARVMEAADDGADPGRPVAVTFSAEELETVVVCLLIALTDVEAAEGGDEGRTH